MSLPEDFLGRIIFILNEYGMSLLKGAGTTLLIALVGTIIGCVIGLIVGTIQAIPIEKKDNIYIIKNNAFNINEKVQKTLVEKTADSFGITGDSGYGNDNSAGKSADSDGGSDGAADARVHP